MNKYKLNFELVPDCLWGYNLRSLLTKKEWDFVRNEAKKRANGHCMICGKKTDKLEGHERWIYDEKNSIQKLEEVISICHDCHSVIHIGFTQLKGNIERAENHFIKVNKCTYAEYVKALGEANENHKRLNQKNNWKLDLTYLQKYIK